MRKITFAILLFLGLIYSYSCNRNIPLEHMPLISSDGKSINHEYLDANNVIVDKIYLNSDTIVINLTNGCDTTIFLFDGYLTEMELEFGVLEDDILYRYNHQKDIFKISFLPLLQYLTYVKWDVLVIGKGRITRGFQVMYSFMPIKAHETVSIKIPFKFPRPDIWLDDFDIRTYNIWDGKGKATVTNTQRSKQHLSNSETPDVFIEFAIYSDTVGLNQDDWVYNRKVFNNKIKSFKVVSVHLTKEIIERIFRDTELNLKRPPEKREYLAIPKD